MLDAGRPEGEVAAEECSENRPSEDGDGVGSDKFSNERHARVLQHTHDVLTHQVEILFTHFRHLKDSRSFNCSADEHADVDAHLVFDFTRVMLDDESIFLTLRLLIKRILLVDVVELMKKIFVTATREAAGVKRETCTTLPTTTSASNLLARVVQNAQQSSRLRFEKVKTAGVVEELNVCPLDAFTFVFLLLVFEDVLESINEMLASSNVKVELKTYEIEVIL